MAAILAMAAIGAWAILTHRISYVVTHGISMNPVYQAGDLVIVLKRSTYEVGQIAAYRNPGSNIEVLHRIIDGNAETGYVLKGDNNQSTDAFNPTADELIGHAVLHAPRGGIWLKPLLSPTGLGMIGFLVMSGSASATLSRRDIPRGRRKKKVKAMARQGNPWATARAGFAVVKQLSPLLQTATAMVVLIAGLALALATLGWMKPAIEQEPVDVSESMMFSYSAKVKPTPAYDNTVVRSPEPIFRKVINEIDLRMRYEGMPGTLNVTAEVSNSSGWHSTLQLLAPRGFSSNVYESNVILDLDAIEERGSRAAEAIGIQPGSLAVAVHAHVAGANARSFTARLRLNLEPLRLTLPDGPSSLVTTKAAGTTPAPRQIRIFGQSIFTASQARAYAVLLLLGALVGATAVFLANRRRATVRTRSEIERRYSQLLVPVEPMASPPGKPVVNVDNFPALVRLSERYGQMILTWRRPDADDFVVRDEGITYRYRVPLEEPTLQNIEHINRPNSTGTHRRKASSQVS